MSDIGISWSVILWLAPILLPFASIPGALLSGFGWYRRKKNVYAALVAGVVGAFALPWACLLVIAAAEQLGSWTEHATPLAKGVLWFVVSLAIVGLVLWGLSHAGSRSRRGS